MIRIQDAKVGQAIKFYLPSSDTERFGIVSLVIVTEDYEFANVHFGHSETAVEMPKDLKVHNLGRVTAEAIHHIHGTNISVNSGVKHV